LLIALITLIAGACEPFDVSLVEYLQKEQDLSGTNVPGSGANTPGGGTTLPGGETNPPWVYVAVKHGDDGNPGWSPAGPIKTLGKALELWAGTGSAEARIMLLDNVSTSDGYSDPRALTGTGLVDFSTNQIIPSSITAVTLAGLEGGIVIDNKKNADRPVLYFNTPNKTLTLKDLTLTGGKGDCGGGIRIGGGAVLIMRDGVFVQNNETVLQGGGVYVENGGTFVMKGGSIRNNRSDYGGGIAINGTGAGMIFHQGTISANKGNSLGGGILIAKGSLDMWGGTVSGNIAAEGPGITVENEGNLIIGHLARVLDAANPIHLYGTSPSRWITIAGGGFTGNYTANIARITTRGPYSPGVEILKMAGGGSVSAYCGYFKVDGKDFGASIDLDGKISP
jgi:hypothetical protein